MNNLIKIKENKHFADLLYVTSVDEYVAINEL